MAIDQWGIKHTGCLNPWLKSAGIWRFICCALIANECFNKAVIEVHADVHRGEFILDYNMFTRMTAGRLFGLNSGDWSIMLGGFALIGVVILLL
jgi:hypothetical protein